MTFDILVHDADGIARTGNQRVYWLAIALNGFPLQR
jgi:hypothetical protein